MASGSDQASSDQASSDQASSDQASALRELAEKKRMLAAMVVHDLRNPLTAIAGNVQLVENIVKTENPRAQRAFRDLRALTEKTLALVASLLDVEELEEGQLQAAVRDVDVGALLCKTSGHQRAVIEFRGLAIRTEIAPALRGRFDPTLIGRVVENLIDNAVRYAPKGGVVVVRAVKEEDDLVIRVLNSGPAIPLELHEAIFDRYHRVEARREGARANRGLGLYFCKLASHAHDGEISVGAGTLELPSCFELRLPQAVSADS